MHALAQAPSARPEPGVQHLLKAAEQHLLGNPREALSQASAAVVLADALDEPAAKAIARRVRGDARRILGQHDGALWDYAESARLYKKLRRPVDAARTEAAAVDSLRSLGRGAEALRLAARARRVLRRYGEEVPAAILDEIVGLVYLQQDDYAKALRLFDRARPVIAAAERIRDLATLNNNAASALLNLDRLREAERLYATARAQYAQVGTAGAVARVDVNLGSLAFRQGRYGAAVDLLRAAADVFEQSQSVAFAVGTCLDLVETYLALNLLDEAGELSQQQLRIATDLGLQSERARALFYLSTQCGRAGQIDEALAGLLEAERAYAQQGNAVWRARCVLGRAALLVSRGHPADLGDAAKLARTAARVFARLALPTRQAAASVVRARALLGRGRLRAAEEEARSALWLAEGAGVPWLLFESHYNLGRALQARRERERAYVAYREAAEALERVRAELQPEELRISLVSDKTDVYQQLVLLCLERSATAEALQYAERAKSRAFTERLATSGAAALDPGAIDGPDAARLERMRELRNELVWFYSRLSDGRPEDGQKSVHRLRREVAAREAELVRLHRRLQPASRPAAAALGVGEATMEAASILPSVRRRLLPGTIVLEYFQAGDELVLFVFDARRLTALRLGPIARVDELVDRFRFQTSKFGFGDAYVQAHASDMQASVDSVLAELYAILIGPAADELVDARQLIIVPHGFLHYLPFHALIDPCGTPLIERVEIAYAPSAGVLTSCWQRSPQPTGPGQAVLFAVPDPAIPQVVSEVEALERVFPQSTVFTGDEATERAFREHAPCADVIHLASHAVFREDNPLFSAIRLSDGWLSLYDLQGLRLRAPLVTLSACETGVQEVLAGDELVGLARGFFQAGAATVVVSLWAADDASTADLMRHMYEQLQSGLSPAAALRAAQLEVRRGNAHPYYWAAFVVMGRP